MEKSIQVMGENIAEILSDNQPSIYLFGSITQVDFRLGWSDIDILCLTETPMKREAANTLLYLRQTLLEKEPENPYYRAFEGILTTWSACAFGEMEPVVYWGTSGQKITYGFTMDAFSTLSLKKRGWLLYGKDRRERIKSPSPEELRMGVLAHLSTIRRHAAETDDSLYAAGWMLDIARCLYTLATWDIIAKTHAGVWALKEGLCPQPDIMKRVVAIRENPMEWKEDPETRAFLKTLGPAIQRFADVLEKAAQGT